MAITIARTRIDTRVLLLNGERGCRNNSTGSVDSWRSVAMIAGLAFSITITVKLEAESVL